MHIETYSSYCSSSFGIILFVNSWPKVVCLCTPLRPLLLLPPVVVVVAVPHCVHNNKTTTEQQTDKQTKKGGRRYEYR